MIDMMISLGRDLLKFLPFLAFIFLDVRTNLKKEIRSRQFLMPVVSVIFCVVMAVFLDRVSDLVLNLLHLLPNLLEQLGMWLKGLPAERLQQIAPMVEELNAALKLALEKMNPVLAMVYILNAVIMLVYLIVKRICMFIMKRAFKTGNSVYEAVARVFYGHNAVTDQWFLLSHYGQARTFMKTLFCGSIVISMSAVLASIQLYKREMLSYPFYPVFGIIVIGEIYFYLCGTTRQELNEGIEGDDEASKGVYNYVILRQVLRRLFGDKLTAEDTTVSSETTGSTGIEDLLTQMERDDDGTIESYSLFMRKKMNAGMELDQNYLRSGMELLTGKSILFNNPFYYDLIPYAFYAMDRTLLKHKKVLIILGRHGIEEDVAKWCQEGLRAVSNVQDMWRIEELKGEESSPDVGIITRSNVHNLKLHEANHEFFEQVHFVVLIEPSRLITTAQVGLNSIVRHCHGGSRQITYCSMDKNCDGLVDALSHVLMTSLTEVSAMNRHRGICSYMCWAPDQDYLQHRMLPNVARYLGVGTELSFAALKNQVSEATWYGGDAFPVVDMRWIVKQYYYDLLNYAGLPADQEEMDKYFKVSPNICNERKKKLSYLTVEDEACNMFEVKRCFSTRAKEQSFINVISSEYLLRDYMAENDKIFDADPKAIPYIVADYARTPRNVALRLALRMSSGYLESGELHKELMLIDADTDTPVESLWHEICMCCQPIGKILKDEAGNEILRLVVKDREYVYDKKTIVSRRRYSLKTGKMEDLYSIEDTHFKRILLDDLQNARYIAEEEDGESSYLGMELKGHIYQKYLPGQFFVFNGKYYEMLSVTSDGQVLVRRAADHITGRPSYRQVRKYYISNIVDSEAMGAVKNTGGLRVVRQYADFCVKTPAYWKMDTYNDFESGQLVTVSGIPDRRYCNKQILRIDFPEMGEKFSKEIRYTLTLLINEVFRTLFAENQNYIAAVTLGECPEPLTYELQGENGFLLKEDAVYIIEDSQMDIGLLVAVERNLNRIFAILCDYLDWHFEALDKSLNPPPQPEPPVFTVPEGTEEKPKGFFGRIKRAIGNFFKKIGGFFKKLFKKKPKAVKPAEPETPAEDITKEPGKSEVPVEESVKEPERAEAAAETAAEDSAKEPEKPEAPAEDAAKESESDFPALMNISRLYDDSPQDVTFEPEKVVNHGEGSSKVTERKPYHERYYLLYGGREVPEQLDLSGTLAFLKQFGYDNGFLKQARSGKDIAEMIEKDYVPNKSGSHYCDFCGVELTGTEYDVLDDGRERCPNCSRTAVKTLEEFEKIYNGIIKNMEIFYGVRITVPVKVEVVNAKKLHKRLGKSFVPTGKPDGRVLGVAIRDKKNQYSILVENGSPRLASTMTIAHELTHIWQYLNWDAGLIRRKYGSAQELEIYEGMAKWSEIQYAYLIGEPATAKREEIITRLRDDEYGRGFRKYVEKYPLTPATYLEGETPFDDPGAPL